MMKFFNLIKENTLKIGHGLSLMTLISIIVLGAISYIEEDVAQVDLFGNIRIELGHCYVKEATGLDCPTCGMTRSFIKLEDGNWIESINYHPFGFVAFGLLIIVGIMNVLYLTNCRYARGLALFVSAYATVLAVLIALRWLAKIIYIII